MKRSLQLNLVLAVSLLSSSCAEKDAREYARKLAELLSSYSQQIDSKLQDEEARYISEAKRAEESIERGEAEDLLTERLSRAQDAADQLASGRMTPEAMLQTVMPAYAKMDFDKSEALYVKAQDDYTSHLKGITHLSMEKAKIEALQQALEALGQKQNLAAQVKQYAKFGSDLKDQINVNSCSAALDTISKRQQTIKMLTADIADPAKAADKERNQKRLEIAQSELKNAQAVRDASGKFKDAKCR